MEDKFRIAVITPETPWADEPARLARLAAAGVGLLHLRHPAQDEVEMRRLLDRMAPEVLPLLRLHSYPALAGEYGLGGVHLGRLCPAPPADTRGLTVSRSLHTPEEFAGAERYHYVTYSPVFPSISKPGYGSPEMLLPPECTVPVLALGGVTPDRFALLQRSGYSGAALLGWLWQPDFDDRLDQLARYLN